MPGGACCPRLAPQPRIDGALDAFAQPGDVGGLPLDPARSLDDDRRAGRPHDSDQRVAVDRPRPEVRVPVGSRVEGVAAVVGVDEVDPAGDRPNPIDDVGEVGASGPCVAGVEAEPDRVTAGRRADGLR